MGTEMSTEKKAEEMGCSETRGETPTFTWNVSYDSVTTPIDRTDTLLPLSEINITNSNSTNPLPTDSETIRNIPPEPPPPSSTQDIALTPIWRTIEIINHIFVHNTKTIFSRWVKELSNAGTENYISFVPHPDQPLAPDVYIHKVHIITTVNKTLKIFVEATVWKKEDVWLDVRLPNRSTASIHEILDYVLMRLEAYHGYNNDTKKSAEKEELSNFLISKPILED